jgi:4-hydroxythreonine-4-phosphate dehydrogenase
LSNITDGKKRPILVTMGEPSGIGPEVAVKAWAALGGVCNGRALHLIGAPSIFRESARQAGIAPEKCAGHIVDVGGAIDARPGLPDPNNAQAVIAALDHAVAACQSGQAAAMVTAPIHKANMQAGGFSFPGHTEYLAARTGVKRAVMMLASRDLDPPLRVIPFTIHIALADVFRHLNKDAVVADAEIVLSALARDFGCEQPRLAIAGLNPHAGEEGLMGREDIEILAPAAADLRARGHLVQGPLSADTLFHDEARKTYDAALCMYHDQALIPIKTLAFWTGVNVTLGLPVVRTSPDHGTALNIAGQGKADARSMIAAIRTAADIANRRGL